MKTINFKKTTLLLLTLLFAGLVFQSCNQSKPLTQAELEGYWVLKAMNGKDAKTEFTGALPTLQFNFQENSIAGTGGCNRYTGAFTYTDGVFAAPNLATTRMLCAESNNESQFVKELSDTGNTLSIVNGILVVSRDKVAVLEFEKGEAAAEKPAITIDATTLGGVWNLKSIDGADATTKFGGEGAVRPSLSLNFADNKVTGNGGCNMYKATFSLNSDQLIVAPIMSTRKACPNMEGESRFVQALSDTSILVLPSENVLQLTKQGTVLLEFEKASAVSDSETKKI